MKQRDLVLAVIGHCANSKQFGRTSLQKVTYFLGEALGRDLGHAPHIYGPFSDVVDRNRESLVCSGLIEETVRTLGFVSQAGHEERQYEYTITDDGHQRLAAVQESYPDLYEQLLKIVDSVKTAAGGLDQNVLSAAAKVLYLANREKRRLDVDEIRSMAHQLGWRLHVEKIQSVIERLHELEFAVTGLGQD